MSPLTQGLNYRSACDHKAPHLVIVLKHDRNMSRQQLAICRARCMKYQFAVETGSSASVRLVREFHYFLTRRHSIYSSGR